MIKHIYDNSFSTEHSFHVEPCLFVSLDFMVGYDNFVIYLIHVHDIYYSFIKNTKTELI